MTSPHVDYIDYTLWSKLHIQIHLLVNLNSTYNQKNWKLNYNMLKDMLHNNR